MPDHKKRHKTEFQAAACQGCIQSLNEPSMIEIRVPQFSPDVPGKKLLSLW